METLSPKCTPKLPTTLRQYQVRPWCTWGPEGKQLVKRGVRVTNMQFVNDLSIFRCFPGFRGEMKAMVM